MVANSSCDCFYHFWIFACLCRNFANIGFCLYVVLVFKSEKKGEVVCCFFGVCCVVGFVGWFDVLGG